MLIFLVGCPRSSKTTWATKWLNYELNEDIVEDYKPRVIVNGDSIRRAISGERWNDTSEVLTHPFKIVMIRALLENGHDVLVDDTHTTKYSIDQLWEIDRGAKYVIIDTDKEECKKRAVQSGYPELIKVIDRTWPQFNSIKTLLLNHYRFLNYLGGVNVHKANF